MPTIIGPWAMRPLKSLSAANTSSMCTGLKSAVSAVEFQRRSIPARQVSFVTDQLRPWARHSDLKGVKVVAGDYVENQLADRMDQPKLIGDIVTHWHKYGERLKTVAFAVWSQYGDA